MNTDKCLAFMGINNDFDRKKASIAILNVKSFFQLKIDLCVDSNKDSLINERCVYHIFLKFLKDARS